MIDLKEINNQTYIVGGAVRDEIMGITPNDIDYCVALNQSDFESFYPDFERVGNAFPVYLVNGNEVALTRTERSTGSGYQDFEFDDGVSIEADLGRRDFTINSIAKCLTTNKIVDPFNGREDIENKIVRTINKSAFRDDPLRIIRGARFAARFNFQIDKLTKMLMRLSSSGIVNIKKERIVLELEKVWKQCEKPSLFFEALADVGALKYIIKPLDDLRYVTAGPKEYHHGHTAFEHTMEVIDRAKSKNAPFLVFIAAILHDAGKGTTDPELLPHHYKHELRSCDIATEFLNNHKFNAKITKTVPLLVKMHMRVFYLEKMRDIKLVRLYLRMKHIWREYFDLVDSDHPLSDEKVMIMFNLYNLRLYKLSGEEQAKIKTVKNKKQYFEQIMSEKYKLKYENIYR